MRDNFRQKMMSLLLSGMVLAWGVIPPGVEHAHTGGNDASHQHVKCEDVAHHDSHNHHGDDGHHEHATVPDVSLLADNVLHLHWQLLGLEFSIPVPEEPADGTEDEGTEDEGTTVSTFVRVMNENVLATQAGPSFGRVLLAATCAPSVDVVWSLEPIPLPLDLVTSIPLCDSARLERSGVLLA